MKKTTFIAMAAFMMSASTAVAQLGKKAKTTAPAPKEFTLDVKNPLTKTGMSVHKGDTLFVDANGNAVTGDYHYTGEIADESGYSADLSRPSDNKYTNEDGTPARHLGVVFLIQDNAGEIVGGEEFSALEEIPYGQPHGGMRRFVVSADGNFFIDLNDETPSNNSGGMRVQVL